MESFEGLLRIDVRKVQEIRKIIKVNDIFVETYVLKYLDCILLDVSLIPIFLSLEN